MKAAILLASLLTLAYLQSGSCNPNRSANELLPTSLAAGTWGGNHLTLEVSSEEATLEFDCAHGSIKSPITLKGGHFDLAGTYEREGPGPTRKDQSSSRQARYSGQVNGETLALTVQLLRPQETIGRFDLVHGKPGKLWKCY